MLDIGGRAPEFTLPDQDDRTLSLSTLLNRGPLILGLPGGFPVVFGVFVVWFVIGAVSILKVQERRSM